jgi:hypothetical protein
MGKLIQDIVLIISGGAKYSASLYLEASGLCTMAVSISDETGTYLSMDTPSVPNSSEMLFESLVISVQNILNPDRVISSSNSFKMKVARQFYLSHNKM